MQDLLRRWERGEPTPAIDNAPVLPEHLMHLWDAFLTLDRSRQWGALGGRQPIQISEIEALGRIRGYRSGDELEELIAVVQYLDLKFFERQAHREG